MARNKYVAGVGINDAGYPVDIRISVNKKNGKRSQKVIWKCPYYARWKEIIIRCYSPRHLKKRPTYKDCIVCDEWLIFSNFKAWMETQDWEGKFLDKDILVQGNREYSPKTCVFVSNVVNCFINESPNRKSETLIGVTLKAGKYIAQCRNPFTRENEYLGRYLTEFEAHQAWLECKKKHAKELCKMQDDPRVGQALVDRYSNYEVSK